MLSSLGPQDGDRAKHFIHSSTQHGDCK